MVEQTVEQYGPPKVGLLKGALKFVAGLAGGVAGTLILIAIFLLSSSILDPVFNPSDSEASEPLFIFIFMIMIFLAALGTNIISSLILAFTERDRYTRISSSIYQIFILNIIVFLIIVPVYIATSSISLPLTAFAVAIHILLTCFGSALILEVMARPKYALLGIYSVTLGILLSLGAIFFIYQLIPESSLLLMFVAIPVVWGCIGLSEGLFYSIYYFIYNAYGTDFLSIKTAYGEDLNIGEEEVVEEEQKDVSGAEFLKRRSEGPPEEPQQETPEDVGQDVQ